MAKKVDIMDIFQRTCIKKGVFIDSDEVEPDIAEVQFLEECEQTQEQLPSVDEELDLKALEIELECMKRRIQMLQLKLKMKRMAQCPEEECVDLEVELTCSENKEICNLQKGQYKLQCQIDELIRCCKLAKDKIMELRERLCDKSREILELQKMVAMLNSWKNTLSHEFGVCLERFEYLKHVKAEWKDVVHMMDKMKARQALLNASFLTKACFASQRQRFVDEINELRLLFKELYDMQMRRFGDLEQRFLLQKQQSPDESPSGKFISEGDTMTTNSTY